MNTSTSVTHVHAYVYVCIYIYKAAAAANMISAYQFIILKLLLKLVKLLGYFLVCVCVCALVCVYVFRVETVILFDVLYLQPREKLRDLPLKSVLQRRTEHMLCSVGSLQSTIAKPPCGITLRRLVSSHCQTLTQPNGHKLYFCSLLFFLCHL